MSETKKSAIWPPEAQGQLRAIDRQAALDISHAMNGISAQALAMLKKLRPPGDELRLRAGDYRVFLYQFTPLSLIITGVKHRSESATQCARIGTLDRCTNEPIQSNGVK